MSEGELLKRMCHIIEREGKETNQSYRGKYRYQAVSKFVEKIVDEAFKEYPKSVWNSWDAASTFQDLRKRDEWFEKWFGTKAE